jgi:hypothetical protein
LKKIFQHILKKLIGQQKTRTYTIIGDLEVLEDGIWIKYDVKGLKKIKRYDKTTNESIHWVEIMNVRGNLGWLYGKADRFAFELNDYYMIIDKEKLQELIKEKMCSKETNPIP